jgi:hypothetical protein
MNSQANTKTAHVNNQELQLRFAQVRSQFADMGIKRPIPIIEWKRPDLTPEQINSLRFALCGRVSPKHAELLPVVEKVLEDLKAA